jgi:hypothetical protein
MPSPDMSPSAIEGRLRRVSELGHSFLLFRRPGRSAGGFRNPRVTESAYDRFLVQKSGRKDTAEAKGMQGNTPLRSPRA